LTAIGASARQRAERLEATRLTGPSGAVALLLRSAEPIDWTRSSIQLAAGDSVPPPVPAGAVKMISASFAAGGVPDPMQESVSIVLLEDHDLSGHALERRILPSPGAPDLPDGTPIWNGDFVTSAEIGGGLPFVLWAPPLADLSGLQLIAPAAGIGVAKWSAVAGEVRQTGTFTTPDDTPPGFPIERPARGTVAIGPALGNADIRISARLAIKPTGAAGVVFRYANEQNYYRFAIDRRRNRRILSRFVSGTFRLLHVAGLPMAGAGTSSVVVEAVGSRVSVWVNGTLFASVVDAGPGAGAVGFYSQGMPQLAIDRVSVDRISRSLGDWPIDDISPIGDLGVWRIAHGALCKDPGAPSASGESDAVIEGGNWADLRMSSIIVPPASAAGEIGLLWRYASAENNLRVAIDPVAKSARIVARSGGADTVLWSGALPLPALSGAPVQWPVTIEAIGHRLRAWIGATLLADIEDSGLGSGTVGAFSGMAGAATFNPFDIRHAAPGFEPWHVFAAEPARVSGRRVLVSAAVAPTGYASPAGEEVEWKGLPAAGFRRGLPIEGVDLRFVDAVRTVLHQRRFRPAAAYAAKAATMVRAADGTGLVLLPSGGDFPQGELRIDFVYRRDNTGADAQSIILSQNGEQLPETVSLHVA